MSLNNYFSLQSFNDHFAMGWFERGKNFTSILGWIERRIAFGIKTTRFCHYLLDDANLAQQQVISLHDINLTPTTNN